DVARAVGGDAERETKARRGPRAVGAAGRARRPGERGDHTRRRDLADCAVAVGDIDTARAVGGNAERVIKARRGPRRVGAAPDARRTGERAYDACGRDLADGV